MKFYFWAYFLYKEDKKQQNCQSTSTCVKMGCFVFINDLRFFEERQVLGAKYYFVRLAVYNVFTLSSYDSLGRERVYWECCSKLGEQPLEVGAGKAPAVRAQSLQGWRKEWE